MSAMVELSPHDSAALSRLIRFDRLPAYQRHEILQEIEAADARLVGEVILDPQKYMEAPEKVRATVDRFKEWMAANRRLAGEREKRRRAARALM